MFDLMRYKVRKSFDSYIADCKNPDKKAAAVKEKIKLEAYRTYKATVLSNPDGMKLQAGKTYRADVIQEPAADQRKRQSGDPVPKLYQENRRILSGKIETAALSTTLSTGGSKKLRSRQEIIENNRRELQRLRVLSLLQPLTKEQQMRRADLVIEMRDAAGL